VNATPRTHPLAGPGATWKGVPLEEPYQRALDARPDRQLNLGNVSGEHITLPRKEGFHQQSKADEVKHEAQAMKDKALGVRTSDKPETTPPDANIDSTMTGHSPVTHKRDGSTASNASSPDTSSPNGSKIGVTKSRMSGSSKGSGTNVGSPHKSSFMDKIKGEVKVISGKLAHDEVKVEEGKRLLGKHV
jgi:hypothetical protein